MKETILLLAKYFEKYGCGTYSFSWFKENLKIKPDACMYALQFLEKSLIIHIEFMPWIKTNWKEVELNAFLEKETNQKHFETKGMVIKIKNKEKLFKIIKDPLFLDSLLNKIKFYPEPYFDKKKSIIFFLNKQCKIPPGNQFMLCKIIFNSPLGEWIEENDLAIAMDPPDTIKSNRFIYDTMIAINRKVKKCFGIEKLIDWDKSKLRIKEKF